jgi:hypothetical protein
MMLLHPGCRRAQCIISCSVTAVIEIVLGTGEFQKCH